MGVLFSSCRLRRPSAGTAKRPSDATMKSMMLLQEVHNGTANDPCFPTAVNRRDGCSLIPPGKPPTKIKSIHRRTDHKSGLKLKAWRFRVDIQTPEANVQHRFVGGRIRDGPIEILHRRITRSVRHACRSSCRHRAKGELPSHTSSGPRLESPQSIEPLQLVREPKLLRLSAKSVWHCISVL